jgi:hypothetical protein
MIVEISFGLFLLARRCLRRLHPRFHGYFLIGPLTELAANLVPAASSALWSASRLLANGMRLPPSQSATSASRGRSHRHPRAAGEKEGSCLQGMLRADGWASRREGSGPDGDKGTPRVYLTFVRPTLEPLSYRISAIHERW